MFNISTNKFVIMCSECGCACPTCNNHNSLEYHHEIADLQSKLSESRHGVSKLELELANLRERYSTDLLKAKEDLSRQKEKYDRLMDSHKKLGKVNQNLEETILTGTDGLISEKESLSTQLESTRVELGSKQLLLDTLQEELDRYKKDCSIAIQLLRTNPTNFIPQTLNSFSNDVRQRYLDSLPQPKRIERLKPQNSPQTVRRSPSYVMGGTFPPIAMHFTEQVSQQAEQSGDVTEEDPLVSLNHFGNVLSESQISVTTLSRAFLCLNCRRRTQFCHRGVECRVEHQTLSSDEFAHSLSSEQPAIFNI